MSDIHSFEPLWGAWVIDELIGQGSHGKVYRAHRTEYGQTRTYYSAIKHISIPQDQNEVSSLYSDGVVGGPESLTAYYENMLSRLLREIEINVSLKGHTNIVSYEDHIVIPKSDGPGYDVFIRMELLTPLPQVLQSRPITEAEVRRLGIDICSALEVMGSRNILHRDIKPSNIFVNASGEFKLGDFGVSRSLEGANGGVTISGTLNYMAPELSRGQNVSFSSDIYSLGLVLYRLRNANRPPFVPLPPATVTADDLERSNAMRFSGQPIPAPAYASPMLAAIILRACEFDPARRFPTASAMRQALSAGDNGVSSDYQQDKTVSVFSQPQSQSASSAQKAGGSGKTLIIILICLCAVLVVTLIVVLLLRSGWNDAGPAQITDYNLEDNLGSDVPESGDSNTSEQVSNTPRPISPVTSSPEPEYEPLLDESELSFILDNYAPYSDSSVYVADVTRNMFYSSGNVYSESISSALINIPILFTILYDVENGYFDMDYSIHFNYELNGRGYISSSNDGEYLSISTLIYAMLCYSDNNAANSLMTFLGLAHIEDVCDYYGYGSVELNAKIGFTSSSSENYVSAADVAGMLEFIWNDGFSGGRSFLLENLYIVDSTAGSGLGAGIHDDYVFMNHNGVRSDLYNEAAIVDNGSETYIVVFMACGDTQSQLMSCAAQIGSYVHSCLK